MSHPVLLYDGVCGLCNRMVQLILRRDRDGVFRFASLQSALAQRVLAGYGVDAVDLDSVYVVTNYNPQKRSEGGADHNEVLLARSDALMFVGCKLGGMWRILAWLLRIAPRALREWGYRAVARRRYRLFGRYEACPAPSEATRARFLEL
jgi:predicted DCC family thiol-disulfide oxidoreductase YuxK